MSRLMVIIPSSVVRKLLSYKDREHEVGGPLKVSILKIKNKVLYVVDKLFESVSKSDKVSAILSSNSPHIWHLHPKNIGAFLSGTDREDLIRMASILSLTLNGVPPLSMVVGFRDKNSIKNEIFYSFSGLVTDNVSSGEILEIKSYIALPNEECFYVKKENIIIDEIQRDNLEGFIGSSIDGKYYLLDYNFIENVLDILTGLSYRSGLLWLLENLRGIYSQGIEIDPVDLMKVLCFFNTLKRLKVKRSEALVIKVGPNEKYVTYSVRLDKEPDFKIVEVETLFLNEKSKLMEILTDTEYEKKN